MVKDGALLYGICFLARLLDRHITHRKTKETTHIVNSTEESSSLTPSETIAEIGLVNGLMRQVQLLFNLQREGSLAS